MANLYCITNEILAVNSSIADFKPYKGRLSREDVATLVEVFEFALKEVPTEVIVDVLRNAEGYFAFLINTNEKGSFDFYRYLNTGYDGGTIIGPVNAKLMFPKALSRGIYTEYYNEYEDEYDDDDDDVATGYMDSDDFDEDNEPEVEEPKEPTIVYELKNMKTGERIQFGEAPTSVGRSSKLSDYVVKGNNLVSRKHCSIWIGRDGKPLLKDEDSSFGTFINNKKLAEGQTVALKDDLEISLGGGSSEGELFRVIRREL